MSENINRVKKLLTYWVARITAYIPTILPQGTSDFEAWADSVIALTILPNNDSMKFTLSAMIVNSSPTAAYMPKEFFRKSLIKAAANQIAGAKMYELKEKQKAEFAAAQQKAEATAPTLAVVSSGDAVSV